MNMIIMWWISETEYITIWTKLDYNYSHVFLCQESIQRRPSLGCTLSSSNHQTQRFCSWQGRSLVPARLICLVWMGLVWALGMARLDVEGGWLLGPHRTVAQVTCWGTVGNVKLAAGQVVIKLALDTLTAPPWPADWAAQRVHQC